MSGDDVKPIRRYDNARRSEQARATRSRVLDAARALLIEQGYPATTMASVARAAGVSVETVYKSFGNKRILVKQVYDVTLVGDDEPVPLRSRPEFRAVAEEPEPRRKLAAYAAVARLLFGRLAPLIGVLQAGARAGEPDLQEWAETVNAERLVGAGGVVGMLTASGALRPGLDPDRARDVLWSLTSVELFELLVGERGWTDTEYESWLAGAMADLLLGPA